MIDQQDTLWGHVKDTKAAVERLEKKLDYLVELVFIHALEGDYGRVQRYMAVYRKELNGEK